MLKVRSSRKSNSICLFPWLYRHYDSNSFFLSTGIDPSGCLFIIEIHLFARQQLNKCFGYFCNNTLTHGYAQTHTRARAYKQIYIMNVSFSPQYANGIFHASYFKRNCISETVAFCCCYDCHYIFMAFSSIFALSLTFFSHMDQKNSTIVSRWHRIALISGGALLFSFSPFRCFFPFYSFACSNSYMKYVFVPRCLTSYICQKNVCSSNSLFLSLSRVRITLCKKIMIHFECEFLNDLGIPNGKDKADFHSHCNAFYYFFWPLQLLLSLLLCTYGISHIFRIFTNELVT